MKNTRVITIVLVSVLMLAADVVSAQGWGRGRGRGYGMGHGMGFYNNPILSSPLLNLSDAQVEKIRKLRTDFQTGRISETSKLDIKEIELDELLSAESPDLKAVNAKIDEIAVQKANLMKKSVEHRKKIMDILTPEQKEMLKKLDIDRPGRGRMQYLRDGRGLGRGLGMGIGTGRFNRRGGRFFDRGESFFDGDDMMRRRHTVRDFDRPGRGEGWYWNR